MQKPVTSTSHTNTIPFPAAHAGPGDQANAAEPAPHAPQTPASGRAPRGRPSEYAPQVIDMVCKPIREVGMSDSAAAESVGMSSSTISRWKQKYPEIVPRLQEARQECRMRHLRNIERL